MSKQKSRRKTKLLVDDEESKVSFENGSLKKKFHVKDLRAVFPKTDAQKRLFKMYRDGHNLFLYGSAGTGKTFLSMYLALTEVLDTTTPYDKLIIVRSIVPTREIGFLPGDLDEKIEQYEAPYVSICNELFPYAKSYENLKKNGYVEFISTSFIRGMTYDNAIILVDEMQNLTAHESDSIITRVGDNSKIVFCGDWNQTDLIETRYEKSGMREFYNILAHMPEFRMVQFTFNDCVRSGLVKSYLQAKESQEQRL
jgi:phosphate starvation-inducible PhoH-like protein/PhoH-like ATPase